MPRQLGCHAALLLLLGCAAARADSAADYLKQARAAWEDKEVDRALALAAKAAAADPRDARGPLLRGMMNEALGRHDEAVADFTRCLERDPKNTDALDHRGSEQFRRGRVAESLADFDAFLKLRPDAAPGHWKRGISLYYLGRYDEGRRQFGAYEKVDTNDVENAVWHYLCAARADGPEKAQKSILKIGKDPRVPMMVVYDLFAGRAKPADVLAAAGAGEVPAAERAQRLFYAHLYLGLYYDARGDRGKALEHMELAAGKYGAPHYMGDVARVHRDLLRKAQDAARRPAGGG
jgi:lipoprotein NlpI